MFDWYLNSSIGERSSGLLLICVFICVTSACFYGLLRSPWAWYRGINSMPIFQVVMWLGALPLIVPFLVFVVIRKRHVARAKFIGNLHSRIYHRKTCEYQYKISSFFLRFPFDSKLEAETGGFRACRVCYPDQEG